jgi:hypothetical protein
LLVRAIDGNSLSPSLAASSIRPGRVRFIVFVGAGGGKIPFFLSCELPAVFCLGRAMGIFGIESDLAGFERMTGTALYQ